jgi:hypothetical protein
MPLATPIIHSISTNIYFHNISTLFKPISTVFHEVYFSLKQRIRSFHKLIIK